MRHPGRCVLTGRPAWGGWLLGGVLMIGAGGCEDAKPETGEPAWDEGIYHVEVELDTADRLAPSSTSDDDSRVGMVRDVLVNNLFLSVWPEDGPYRCMYAYGRTNYLIQNMQVWVGDWSADLLLPTGYTCFDVDSNVLMEELDLDPDFVERWRYEGIYCDADTEDSVLSENGEPVSIDLEVTCKWHWEGDCEGCD